MHHVYSSRVIQSTCCQRWSAPFHSCIRCPASPCVLQSRDEVRVLSSMAHPNIVLYHECFHNLGKQYIAMEFCEARHGFGLSAPLDESVVCSALLE